jgi:hypothetical protein
MGASGVAEAFVWHSLYLAVTTEECVALLFPHQAVSALNHLAKAALVVESFVR